MQWALRLALGVPWLPGRHNIHALHHAAHPGPQGALGWPSVRGVALALQSPNTGWFCAVASYAVILFSPGRLCTVAGCRLVGSTTGGHQSSHPLKKLIGAARFRREGGNDLMCIK
jgi:hypothetical protein